MARIDNELAFSSFRGPSGRSEHTITVAAPHDISLSRQIDTIAQRYAEALQSLRLAPETAVFRRVYLSDAANQSARVQQSSLCQEPFDSPVAVSIVQQPPLPGGKVALLAYHVDGPARIAKRRVSPGHLLVESGGLGHLWSTQLCAADVVGPADAADQTRGVFSRLVDTLAANGANLAGNCVRTWIFV